MKKLLRPASLLLSLLLTLSVLTGCQPTAASEPAAKETIALATTASIETETAGLLPEETEELPVETAEITETAGLESTEAATEAQIAESLSIDRNGSYDSADDVALYLHLYGELPENYISKKEAQKKGWSGGSVEQVAPGKCIGGSTFGNNEGILPVEDKYHECDIETLGKSKRGPKRIVYSNDGDIYYTEDHYETFTLLYTAEGPAEEGIVYGAH